ncbi:MAG: SIMPL domain-containing protein [Acidobacteriota bacterium]|nr:SIMPL domain-containing protein [Acidobacteriota bacterium]
MKTNLVKSVLLSLTLILFAVALYVFRPNQNSLTRITVVGDSQMKIAPDTAVVTFAVVTQGSQAVNAQQENARKSEAVKQAVEATSSTANKIEVKTDNYNLSPEQDYYSGKMPKIIGYEVKNSVTATIGDLTQVGAIIDAATKAGANSVEGISFVVRQDSPAQGDALALATKQALTKAEAIAKSLNGRIVRIVETNEGGIQNLPILQRYSSNSMMTNTSMNSAYVTPVQAGALDVRSQVILVVEVEI